MSECKYCKKESFGRPFCPDCGKKYFGINYSEEIKSESVKKPKNNSNSNTPQPQNKDKSQLITNTSNRQCNLCSNNARIGSYYCDFHHKEFILNQQKELKERAKIINLIKKNYQEHSYIKNNSENNICKICGACSYDMPFCYSCYKSFIKEEPYDSFKDFENDKKYVCKSGIKVRSISEREISNFFTENNIPHEYEKELKYKFTNYYFGETFIKSLHPDFYIPGPINFKGRILKDIYIEFWGFDDKNIEYTNTKKFKIKNYKDMGITLINLNTQDIINIEHSLTYKLLNYHNNEINF